MTSSNLIGRALFSLTLLAVAAHGEEPCTEMLLYPVASPNSGDRGLVSGGVSPAAAARLDEMLSASKSGLLAGCVSLSASAKASQSMWGFASATATLGGMGRVRVLVTTVVCKPGITADKVVSRRAPYSSMPPVFEGTRRVLLVVDPTDDEVKVVHQLPGTAELERAFDVDGDERDELLFSWTDKDGKSTRFFVLSWGGGRFDAIWNSKLVGRPPISARVAYCRRGEVGGELVERTLRERLVGENDLTYEPVAERRVAIPRRGSTP